MTGERLTCRSSLLAMRGAAQHWDGVYSTKSTDSVSWFQPEPAVSLRLLTATAPPPSSVIDVGAGAGALPDRLLAGGWSDVTVLDVSEAALSRVRSRLGPRAAGLTFVVADLLSWQPTRTFDAWQDRAVFHFLTDVSDRDRYVALATAAVRPRGVVIIGAFAADGPTHCSGLPTARYDAASLGQVFAPVFTLEHAEREQHHTPTVTIQPFTWAVLRHH